ncbi:hypothetical protein [Spirosoma fluminis]
MTRDEFHALADAHFDRLNALQDKPTFFEFEEEFTQIWTQLGQQVLQASLGKPAPNPRKKTVVKPDLAK